MGEPAIRRILPEVFQAAADRSPPLAALLAVADDLHAPVRKTLDDLDEVVDPFRAPDRLVALLASWVDLGWLTLPDRTATARAALAGGSSRLRDLVAASADLSARRGTPAGLVRFLHLATGVPGFEVEAVPGAFHTRVRVPAAAADQLTTIERVVAALKPAHVTAEVVPEPATGPAAAGRSETEEVPR